MKSFLIGEFFIDVTRCRVSSGDYEVVLEPKVMDVLQFLYSRRGEVVSQQEIYTAVWPSTTFNPSSVQRCIALIRKALKEDTKNAKFLITHPKRGYCLEGEGADIVTSKKPVEIIKWLVIAIVIGAFSFLFFEDNTVAKKSYSKLTPITSNESNEHHLMISPSGDLIAFIRGDQQHQNIWLKDLKSESEIQLTHRASNYVGLGWNREGSALAFVENIDDKNTLSYLTIDKLTLQATNQNNLYLFPDGLASKGNLYWNNQNHIYFIEENNVSGGSEIAYFNLKDKSINKVFKTSIPESIVALALSNDGRRLAIGVSIGQNLYRLDMIELKTLETTTLTTVENNITSLSWHPKEDSILISNRKKIQLVNMAGKVSDIEFNNYRYISHAQFNQSGHEILMILSNVDFDILYSSIENFEYQTPLINSAALDFNPVFSPDSKRFIFESHRSGNKQLYLHENGQQRMIFSNPNNEELFGAIWATDGAEVIAASKNKLFRINVQTASFVEIQHKYEPFYLRDHFNKQNALLVSYRIGENVVPAKLNLDTMELTTYTCAGESITCYSMALDQQDNIYFTNDQELFKINSELKPERLWRSDWENTNILRISNNSILLNLSSDKHYKVSSISIENGDIETIYEGQKLATDLTNVSPDLAHYLFLSKPNFHSELVRLK